MNALEDRPKGRRYSQWQSGQSDEDAIVGYGVIEKEEGGRGLSREKEEPFITVDGGSSFRQEESPP